MITDPEEILAEVERMRGNVEQIAKLMDYRDEQEAIVLPPDAREVEKISRLNNISAARTEIAERREVLSDAATALFGLDRISIFGRAPGESPNPSTEALGDKLEEPEFKPTSDTTCVVCDKPIPAGDETNVPVPGGHAPTCEDCTEELFGSDAGDESE
jgi:hypothetical protein